MLPTSGSPGVFGGDGDAAGKLGQKARDGPRGGGVAFVFDANGVRSLQRAADIDDIAVGGGDLEFGREVLGQDAVALDCDDHQVLADRPRISWTRFDQVDKLAKPLKMPII